MAFCDNVSGRPSAPSAAKTDVPAVPSSSDARRQAPSINPIVARTSPEVFTNDTARHHPNARAAPPSEHQALTGFSEVISSVFARSNHIALERDSYAHSFRSYSLKDASETISRQRFAASAAKTDVPAVPTNLSDGKLQAFSVNHIVSRTSPDVFSSGKPGRQANGHDAPPVEHEPLPGFSELINPEFSRSGHLSPASANGSHRRDITLGRSERAHTLYPRPLRQHAAVRSSDKVSRPPSAAFAARSNVPAGPTSSYVKIKARTVSHISPGTSPELLAGGTARRHGNAPDTPPAEHQASRRPPRLGLTTDHPTDVPFAPVHLECMAELRLAELRRIHSLQVDALRDAFAKRKSIICKNRSGEMSRLAARSAVVARTLESTSSRTGVPAVTMTDQSPQSSLPLSPNVLPAGPDAEVVEDMRGSDAKHLKTGVDDAAKKRGK